MIRGLILKSKFTLLAVVYSTAEVKQRKAATPKIPLQLTIHQFVLKMCYLRIQLTIQYTITMLTDLKRKKSKGVRFLYVP